MNLPLHTGWFGAFEAGAIAFVIACLVYLVVRAVARKAQWNPGHAVAWSCLLAIAIAGGVDIWNLFYISTVRLESPLYARIVLKAIHDPDHLAVRVTLEILGAILAVVLCWIVLEGRSSNPDGQGG